MTIETWRSKKRPFNREELSSYETVTALVLSRWAVFLVSSSPPDIQVGQVGKRVGPLFQQSDHEQSVVCNTGDDVHSMGLVASNSAEMKSLSLTFAYAKQTMNHH